MAKKEREAERVLAPNEIPQEGCDVVVSGKDAKGKPKAKKLHVTPARRACDWLAYEMSEDGHETLVVKGLTALAKSNGWEAVDVKQPDAAPAKPKAEPGEPLPVAVKAGP